MGFQQELLVMGFLTGTWGSWVGVSGDRRGLGIIDWGLGVESRGLECVKQCKEFKRLKVVENVDRGCTVGCRQR